MEISAKEGYGVGWGNKEIMGEEKGLQMAEDVSHLESLCRLAVNSHNRDHGLSLKIQKGHYTWPLCQQGRRVCDLR